jgi:hypothetical protein
MSSEAATRRRTHGGIRCTRRRWISLQTRHPDIRFSLDTDNFDTSRIPRNAQVWTFHSYYLWPVYGLLRAGPDARRQVDLNDPAAYAPIRRFLRRDLVPFQTILDSRAGRPPMNGTGIAASGCIATSIRTRCRNWSVCCRRIWKEHRRVQAEATDAVKHACENCATRFSPVSRWYWARAPATARITVSAGRSVPTPTGKWSNTQPAPTASTDSGAPWHARIPDRKTRFGTSTPSGCSVRTPCSWARSRDVNRTRNTPQLGGGGARHGGSGCDGTPGARADRIGGYQPCGLVEAGRDIRHDSPRLER